MKTFTVNGIVDITLDPWPSLEDGRIFLALDVLDPQGHPSTVQLLLAPYTALCLSSDLLKKYTEGL